MAIIAFYDEQGKILLQERDDYVRWGFFGGRIEPGETKEQALVREIKEELDHDLTTYEYLGQFESETRPNYLARRHLFIAPIWTTPENLDIREGKSAQLFTLEETRKLPLFPGDEEGLLMLEKALK